MNAALPTWQRFAFLAAVGVGVAGAVWAAAYGAMLLRGGSGLAPAASAGLPALTTAWALLVAAFGAIAAGSAGWRLSATVATSLALTAMPFINLAFMMNAAPLRTAIWYQAVLLICGAVSTAAGLAVRALPGTLSAPLVRALPLLICALLWWSRDAWMTGPL